tara:strand:+ start:667 stop:1197 length:531 start_codon:yes stop_codon:yes gene_type:complete
MTKTRPKHPGQILFDQVMQPLKVSRNKLARDIDVPVGRISEIVSGKRGLTPDTALRIGKYFGTTPELWLRLQAEYDLHIIRSTTWKKAERKVSEYQPSDFEFNDHPDNREEIVKSEKDMLKDQPPTIGTKSSAQFSETEAPKNSAEKEEPEIYLGDNVEAGDDDIDIPEPTSVSKK